MTAARWIIQTAVRLRSLAIALYLFGILAGHSLAADNAGRTLPPSAAEQKAASGLVREIFGAEAAKATTPDAKAALAAKLIEQAADGANPTESYVLLSAAWKLAAEAGDVAAATTAVKALDSRFAIDGRGLMVECLELAATKAPVRELSKTVDALLAISRDEADADRLEAATDAAQLAATAARRSNDAARRQACTEQLQSLKALAKQTAEIQPLLDRLRTNPADAEAAAELGKIRCFEQGRWDEGLPLLARGNAADLVPLAKLEADETATSLRLGDAWWAFGGDDKALHAAAARSRAAFHYAAALPDLKGLEKARIEKRLQDFAAEDTGKGKSRRPRPPAPGLVLWLDASDTKSIRTFSGVVLDKARGPTRIAAWGDLSGAGHAAQQNVPELQPTWTPDGFGKLPAVEFNGKTGLIIDMPCSTAGTIIVAAKPKAVKDLRIVGCHPPDKEHRNCVVISFRSNGGVLFEATTSNAASVLQTTDKAYVSGEPHVLLASWGRMLSLAMDGKPLADSRPVDQVGPLPGPWGIGMTFVKSPAFAFEGCIAEILIFDRELPPNEHTAVVQQVRRKWGVFQ